MIKSCIRKISLTSSLAVVALRLTNTASGLLLSSPAASTLRQNKRFMLANSNSGDGDSTSSTTASSSTHKEIIDLQSHTLRRSPAETLLCLSEACQTLGVNSFDVYGDYQSSPEESFLRRFESEVAGCFEKDDAVFCLSGGMAQSIALVIHSRSHASASNIDGSNFTLSFACHPTSHLLLHEHDAYSELLGIEAALIVAGNKDFDIEDFKQNGSFGLDPMRFSHVRHELLTDASLTTHPNQKTITCNDVSTLILELPHREIGGKLTPWDDVLRIAELCEKRKIKFHCDGARIFEASAGYGHETLAQTAKPFDSVYISFYKGLGAISGAMLLGDSDFVAEARVWLRRFGGNLYSQLPYAVSAWAGFRESNLIMSNKSLRAEFLFDSNASFVKRQQKLARVIASLNADSDVSSIVQFDPAIPETNMIHGYFKHSFIDCKKALDKVEQNTGIRVLNRLREINHDSTFGCRFEWTMGTANLSIDDKYFLIGWQELSRALRS